MSNIDINLTLAGRNFKLSVSVDYNSKTDNELIQALRIGGCPEPEVSNLMARAVQPGDFVVDGGANVGFFSLLLSKCVGPTGYVYAFEPGQNNLVKLKDNLKLNQCNNVEVIAKPLWNIHETLQLHMCEDGGKNSLAAHADTRGVDLIESAVLNDYATEDALQKMKLIKLDIEGAEEKALDGARNFLRNARCPYIVMELNAEALPKFNSSAQHICDFLYDFGYFPFLLHYDGQLPTYIPRGTIVHPGRLNWNVLFSTSAMVREAWPEITV
jgi:FkbM family methyltransferase